jgi:hypothetical protein
MIPAKHSLHKELVKALCEISADKTIKTGRHLAEFFTDRISTTFTINKHT